MRARSDNLPGRNRQAESGQQPGWHAFDDAYPVMIFDAAGGVRAGPRGDKRLI